MSEHKITLTWKRGDTPFEYQKYPRDHAWKFEGGHEMQSIGRTRLLANAKLVNPEEAICRGALKLPHADVPRSPRAKRSSCSIEYVDEAAGFMEKNAEGKLAITRVNSSEKTKFSGAKQPTTEELEEMNHAAHGAVLHCELGKD